MNYLWVVEMQIDGEWQSTVCTSINRDEARKRQKAWQKKNGGCPCRLRKYVRAD